MTEDDQVLIFTMNDPSRALGLADELRRDSDVRTAVVLERTSAGQLRVVDQDVSSRTGVGMATGGLIGALVGVLAGPVGVLLGWSAGLVGGSAVDLAGVADDDDGLDLLARGIKTGTTAVIAEVVSSTFPAQDRATAFDATVVRFPASEVADEVESAQQAASAAARAAREQRRAQRRSDLASRLHHVFEGADS